MFQLLLKGCTIEAANAPGSHVLEAEFQLLLKGCTIEAQQNASNSSAARVSVVVERMYD